LASHTHGAMDNGSPLPGGKSNRSDLIFRHHSFEGIFNHQTAAITLIEAQRISQIDFFQIDPTIKCCLDGACQFTKSLVPRLKIRFFKIRPLFVESSIASSTSELKEVNIQGITRTLMAIWCPFSTPPTPSENGTFYTFCKRTSSYQ